MCKIMHKTFPCHYKIDTFQQQLIKKTLQVAGTTSADGLFLVEYFGDGLAKNMKNLLIRMKFEKK